MLTTSSFYQRLNCLYILTDRYLEQSEEYGRQHLIFGRMMMLTGVYLTHPSSIFKKHVRISTGTEVTTVSLVKLWFVKFKVCRRFQISWSRTTPLFMGPRPFIGFWILAGFHSQVSILSSLIELSYKRTMDG